MSFLIFLKKSYRYLFCSVKDACLPFQKVGCWYAKQDWIHVPESILLHKICATQLFLVEIFCYFYLLSFARRRVAARRRWSRM